MSASTSEAVPCEPNQRDPGSLGQKGEKKIIDIEIESLVVMMEALHALGDAFAIFGFSGYGRDSVEYYPIKEFSDPYSETLKRRIGGIQPKMSTRMGPAIRHSIEKMKSMDSDQRLLILLSDGFPQDHDYGEDRRSKEYALQDTMMAMMEAKREGIQPFCITVDQGGNDYLGKMCDPRSYLVVKDAYGLPETLPKVVESLMV
jgi:nitric oxide reductase NorD protein